VDPAAGAEMPVWTRQRWRWCDIETDTEEERACGMDPTVVGEAVGEALAVEVWRRLRSGRVGGGEMTTQGL
jgi:hypothetical protein